MEKRYKKGNKKREKKLGSLYFVNWSRHVKTGRKKSEVDEEQRGYEKGQRARAMNVVAGS